MEEFKTHINNNSGNLIRLKSPRNYFGSHFVIQPKSRLTVEFTDERYFLAPYAKVVYKKTGGVLTQGRAGYKPPVLAFPSCVFLNESGADTEILVLDANESIYLPRGIAVSRTVPIFSLYAEYEAVTVKTKQVPVPDIHRIGLIKYESRPDLDYQKRSKNELDRLKAMREDAYLKSVGFNKVSS